jgi:hypothetical protein
MLTGIFKKHVDGDIKKNMLTGIFKKHVDGDIKKKTC